MGRILKNTKKKIKYTHSKQYYIDKYGKIEGEKRWIEINKSKAITLENMIKKYGEKEGKIRYEKWKEETSQTKENMIKRYGEEEGKKKWNIFIEKRKYISSGQYYIDKYGEERGKEVLREIRRHYSITKENMIKKYGKEEGEKRYEKWKKGISNNTSFYSKQSIEFLEPIYEFIIQNNFTNEDIYWKENEYKIYDKENNKINFYDFTIPKLNLIVEFHGSIWHYNPNYNYKEDFKQPFSGESIEELKEKDEYKRQLTIKNGFTLFEVFDTDDFEEKQKEIIEWIKEKLNE